MTDLINWYNSEEEIGKLTPIELAALFHYRYIRIHPFEDGNGRIARLMANYILSRHGLPMIVVRSRKKQDYLEALHQADMNVGKVPNNGAHATINDIAPFLQYFQGIVANEIYNDYLFVTHRDENVWWYDGEMIEFRTPNYAKMLRMMQTHPSLTIEEIRDSLGISITAVHKLITQLLDKNYVERNLNDNSWRVIITPSL